MTSPPFQILSLDGGGIKGLFSAAILAAVEEDLGTSIVDHFDLITGTSTGGIIALGLASGKLPREVVEFYQRHHRGIFSHQYGRKWLRHWLRPRHRQEPLVEALKCSFQDKQLGDCTKRVLIPAYNLGQEMVGREMVTGVDSAVQLPSRNLYRPIISIHLYSQTSLLK